MKQFFRRLGLLLGGVLLFLMFFLIGASLTQTLPRVFVVATGIKQWEYQPREQSVILFSDGQEMTRLGYKRVYRADYPDFMEEAVVAVEDRRFYEHAGLDTRSIGRALWNNIRSGSKSEGGSTITQQLARTLFLTQEKTYSRKIKEVFIATSIEEKYGKSAILNMYLNEVYMGRGCSGLACASQAYFGMEVEALDRAQICMLVGLIQAPEYYNPETNFPALKNRQETVINVLVDQGILAADEGQAIKEEPLHVRSFQPDASNHPYLRAYISSQIEEMLGSKSLYQAGLKIYTTVDSRMQNAAEKTVRNHARAIANRGITARDLALVSVEPASGAIKAMAGGVDYNQNQLNMAVLPRQPGSAIKPLYYAAAMDSGIIQADTVLNNRPRDFGGGYTPRNDGNAPVKVTASQALINSYNVASVEVLNMLGIETAAKYLREFGVTTLTEEDKNLALGLGGMSKGISPLEMAAAFAVFPAGGIYEQPYTIEKIEDASGKILYLNRSRYSLAISSNTAQKMDDILKKVVRYGTGTGAAMALPSGGKTGTTTDSRDLWYVGYTSELCTAVWAGNSDGAPVSGYGTYGGRVSAPVWRDYMNSLYYGRVFKKQPAFHPDEEQEEENEEEAEPGEEDTTPAPGEEESPDSDAGEKPSEPDATPPGEEPSPPGTIPGEEGEKEPGSPLLPTAPM